MAAIPSYYSSDDDVSWGPRTLREIKRDLKRKVRPKRRHSDHRFFTSNHRLVVSKENLPLKDMRELLDGDNISGNSSQYFTANETKRSSSTDRNTQLPLMSNQDYNIDNFQITLANSFSNFTISNRNSNHSNANMSSGSVISISDDESEDLVNGSIALDEVVLESIKTEPGKNTDNEKIQYVDHPGNIDLNSEDLETSDYTSYKLENSRSVYKDDTSIEEKYTDSSDEIERGTIPLDRVLVDTPKKESSKNTNNNTYQDNISIEDYDTSASTSAKLDWSQNSEEAERTNSEEECDELNTTLDYIEKVLRGGLISQNKGISPPQMASTSHPKEVSKIPVPKTPQVVKKTDGFKVPQSAVSKLQTPKMKSNLKNIVSPVGLYIKYSPTAALFRSNANQNADCAHSITKCHPVNTYKFINLPPVIYKPSKKTTVIPRKNLFLPPSIEKMVQEPAAWKHEKKRHGFDINQIKLLLSMDGNITDDESFYEEVNESIHVNKNTFL